MFISMHSGDGKCIIVIGCRIAVEVSCALFCLLRRYLQTVRGCVPFIPAVPRHQAVGRDWQHSELMLEIAEPARLAINYGLDQCKRLGIDCLRYVSSMQIAFVGASTVANCNAPE